MAYELSWLLDKRIIHLRTFGVLSTEEYRSSAGEILESFDNGIAPVHVIVDHLDVEKIEFDPKLVKELIFAETHANGGWTILVSASKLAKFSLSMITQLNKVPMNTCDTVQQALVTLQRVDQTLPDLTPAL